MMKNVPDCHADGSEASRRDLNQLLRSFAALRMADVKGISSGC